MNDLKKRKKIIVNPAEKLMRPYAQNKWNEIFDKLYLNRKKNGRWGVKGGGIVKKKMQQLELLWIVKAITVIMYP